MSDAGEVDKKADDTRLKPAKGAKMGIHFEIKLRKPANHEFIPGEMVEGVIKYSIDQETSFKTIKLSLKRKETLKIYGGRRVRNDVEHVNIAEVIQENNKTLPIGVYERGFSFKLPTEIPPTVAMPGENGEKHIHADVKYYVQIKFEYGMFSNKRFTKAITVVSLVTPTWQATKIKDQKLFRWFRNVPNTVQMIANINSCSIAPGGTITINYEVFNGTHVIVDKISIKLKEKIKFKPRGDTNVEYEKTVPGTDIEKPLIPCDRSQCKSIEIKVPPNCISIDNCKLALREYFVKITAELPFPHFNAYLEIPIQISSKDNGNSSECVDPPPSEWEVMYEED